ncbi:hypothetical protein L9F63_004936, partial [Diploptera punctata]
MAGKIVIYKEANKCLVISPEDFMDDLRYIAKGLGKGNPVFTRCLSVLHMTNKFLIPEFREYIKSTGIISKLFEFLQDAAEYELLGLFTTSAMFALSRDLQEIDGNKNFLNLLVNLTQMNNTNTKSANELSDSQLIILQDNARKLCQEVLKTTNCALPITESFTLQKRWFALETLLNLPQQYYSQWFKDVLHDNGVMEQIIDTFYTKCHLDSLECSMFKYLQFLANVSDTEKMQHILLTYNDGKLVKSLMKVCKVYGTSTTARHIVDRRSSGSSSVNVLISALKVLVNITHNYGNENVKRLFLTEDRGNFMDICLNILFTSLDHAPKEIKAHLILVDLILLTNLVEENRNNRKLLFEFNLPSEPNVCFFD